MNGESLHLRLIAIGLIIRAIMFHIGIATQHPPLPEPEQMSDLGIDFVEQCLMLDATNRPTAAQLFSHPWITMLSEDYADWQTAEDSVEPGSEYAEESLA